jgi:hypothetical protein
MAKETGNMESSVMKTIHHASPVWVDMTRTGVFSPDQLGYRFGLIRDNLKPVLDAVKKIREAANKGDCAEIIKLLDGPFEFGHNWQSPGATSPD